MRIQHINIALPALSSAMAIMLAGCVSSSGLAPGTPPLAAVAPISPVPPGLRIVVLAPDVEFEDTVSENPLESYRAQASALATSMALEGVSAFRARGEDNSLAADEAGLSPAQLTAARQATALASRLTRSRFDAATLALLQQLRSDGASVAALAQFVRVKVGPRGTWDPNSGAITSNASSSQLRASLIDCQTGGVLWRNSVELRKIPSPGSGDFKNALSLLYSTINCQSKHTP